MFYYIISILALLEHLIVKGEDGVVKQDATNALLSTLAS